MPLIEARFSAVNPSLLAALLYLGSAIGLTAWCSAAPAIAPLEIVARIPLGGVRGRLDHLAIDLARNRVFVAELGNDSVGIVDLHDLHVIGGLASLGRPQGVAYLASTDTLVVATGGDGTVRLFHGKDLAAAGLLEGLPDADNVRIAPRSTQVFVGYGAGALAVLDGVSARRMGDIRLPGHPESFQLETNGPRAYVNVPEADQIAVIDRVTHRQLTRWGLPHALGNFAMALDERRGWLWVAYRRPARIAVFSTRDGSLIADIPACADADDIFVDDKRHEAYVSCGEGVVQVLGWRAGVIREIGRMPTSTGARTALFVPELDELIVAVPAQGQEQAALWLLRPSDASLHAGEAP